MSGTPGYTSPWYPEGQGTQLPPGGIAFNQAAQSVGQGQGATFDASGNVAVQDGITPLQVSAGVGWPAKLSDANAVAGIAKTQFWQGFGAMVNSTVANDGFTAADVVGTPAFWAGDRTVGKLSNVAGNDRSFAGMAYGLNDDGLVRIWAGPQAAAVARSIHAINAESAGNLGYAADATAGTTQGTLTGGTALLTIGQVLPRAKRHGVITSVEIIPSAALALALTNYRVVQLWKLDTTGTVALAASPLVATFSTLTQNLVAGQPTQFTLGAASALIMRETDILVMTSVPTASGATVPQSAIRANFKVV